ncbi:MAG: SEC-C metal-binding domain-containing protein [Verrucomicrobiales bacterium]|nr:SEC-C metal-binding domain-containing protein [Verrucomicrobiales bacterium]
MSKLSYETIVSGVKHEDMFVRSGALIHLVESGIKCQTDVSNAVIDCLEKYGWENAFSLQAYISNLPVDESIAQRLLAYLANGKDEQEISNWEELRIETIVEWFSDAPPEVNKAYINELDLIASLYESSDAICQHIKFEISLLDADTEKCYALLEDYITECVDGEGLCEDEILRIRSVSERLAKLGALNSETVMPWINQDVTFEDDFGLTREEMKVCIGFEMAKAGKVPVPLDICQKNFDYQFDWLSTAVAGTLIETADEAVIDELLKRYPTADTDGKVNYLLILEKVRIPGREDKLRDLAALEKHLSLRANLGMVLCYYGTNNGLKYAREIVDGMAEEIEASDIIDVLYALRKLNDETSSELDEWREMLQEIHTVSLKMMSEDLDLYGDPEEFNPKELSIRAVTPYENDSTKINRNDPCPCGSGKKFKKCCINSAN